MSALWGVGETVHTYTTQLLGSVWVWREMQISFQALFHWGHTPKQPCFVKKGRLQLRPFKKPYKEATTLHQTGFGTGSGGGVREG